MSKKKHKVVVLGLPKTGTSTLAVMLRMLNYRVTGPDIKYKKGDLSYLNAVYNDYDGFQDYPWCFEWERFYKDENTKFIVLLREKQSWWKSFYESYGGKQDRYLSYPFFQILKDVSNKSLFMDFYDTYYATIDTYFQKDSERFLKVYIHSFQWKELCGFLEEDLPKNMLGKLVKKPHVNKEKSKTSRTLKYKVITKIKIYLTYLIGKENWIRFVVFLRKNNMI